MRILFVANGHGETAIAGSLGRELAAGAFPFALDLLPLVGVGNGAGPLELVGPRRAMPSGGLVAMGNVRAFARDLRAGFARLLAAQLAFLRAARSRYAVVVAVGDVYALALALLARSPTVFVGTAKSVYVAPYGPFERFLLRRARRTFVRDRPTAERLRRAGVPAEAPGNAIVDLVRDDVPAAAGTWLGILPGSRDEAYADGVRLAGIARILGRQRPDVGGLFSVAPALDPARFARELEAAGWQLEAGRAPSVPFEARADGVRLRGWQGELGALLAASVAVLGQAGTANEQAAARGVPVIALQGRGGDWYRTRQQRLLGEALLLVPPEPAGAALAIADLLADEPRMARMRRTGRDRMGPPGGIARIAQAIRELALASPAAAGT